MSKEIDDANPIGYPNDPSERCDAITRLAAYPPAEAVQNIVPYLKDVESIVVEHAIRALSLLPGGIVLRHVTPLLLSPNPSTRMVALEIARRVTLDEAAKKILVRLCASDDEDIRLFTLEIVLAHTPDDMLDLLLDMRFDPNQNVALKAIECLGGMSSDQAIQALAEELHGDDWHRTAAIGALGRSPMGTATKLLLELQVTAFDDYVMVLHALRLRADPMAIPYLLKLISDGDRSLLPHVLSGLAAICSDAHLTGIPAKVGGKIGLLPYAQYFSDDRSAVRKAAISLAASMGNKDHLILMVEHFARADSEERSQIVNSIALMPFAEADEILEILSRDEDPAIAVQALEHLRKGHA